MSEGRQFIKICGISIFTITSLAPFRYHHSCICHLLLQLLQLHFPVYPLLLFTLFSSSRTTPLACIADATNSLTLFLLCTNFIRLLIKYFISSSPNCISSVSLLPFVPMLYYSLCPSNLPSSY